MRTLCELIAQQTQQNAQILARMVERERAPPRCLTRRRIPSATQRVAAKEEAVLWTFHGSGARLSLAPLRVP